MKVSAAPVTPRASALIPFGVFLAFYLGLSLWAQDFYSVPMPVAFLVAGVTALAMRPKVPLREKIDCFTAGMGESNIMLMCLIFVLAGAFAAVAKAMGAVDAAVLLTRRILPDNFILAGMFGVSCLISLAIGTSCGTIAALTPIALGLLSGLPVSPDVMLGAVIGGAMFGDNLSLISDTTIAATRTQDVAMRDKFRANLLMVLPGAAAVLVLYLFSGGAANAPAAAPVEWQHVLAVLPYLAVLVCALAGWDVVMLLTGGIVLACAIGVLTGGFGCRTALDVCGKGVLGMSETLIVALLAGGLLAVIRHQGGVAFVMDRIAGSVRSAKGAELGIFALTGAVNLFTANNTVAIIIAGPLARELGGRFHCDPKRIAGILDTASCFVQGLIPYGAQILIAAGVAKTAGSPVSTLGLVEHLYYPWIMGLSVILFILLRRTRPANA